MPTFEWTRLRIRWDTWSFMWIVEGSHPMKGWELVGRWYEWRGAVSAAYRMVDYARSDY